MNRPRILIVDDEPKLRTMFRLLLQRTGLYLLETAGTGAHALEVASESRPDLVFLDYCLPDATGLDIALSLQKDPALCGVQIVLMTGMATDYETCFGDFPVLAKPVRDHNMTDCAASILDPAFVPAPQS